MDAKRVHVVIHGTVQGVFFRHSTREEAQRRGLRGWVRNADQGTVEAEFEGPPDAVDQLVAFCRQGPQAAVVTDVEVAEVDLVGGGEAFEVR